MDSKQGPEGYTLDQVKSALSSGALTREEMIGRLKGAIIEEERKPHGESDRKLIVLYGRILYELETGKPYVSAKDDALRQVKARLAADDQRRVRLRPIKRIAVVLTAMVVLVTGVEVFLHRERLFGRPSEDEQRYIIKGNSVDPELISSGVADSEDTIDRITTKNLDHAIMVLGYTPQLPSWVPDGWTLKNYYANRSDSMSLFSVSFHSKTQNKLLKYEVRSYSDVTMVNEELEQDGDGEKISISGSEAYYKTNLETTAIVWNNDMKLYSVTGPLDKETLMRIQESIDGGTR